MQSEAQTITVTVKVPFVGDRSLITNSLETVRELIDHVLLTCQRSNLPNAPHCIVQHGRVLSESDTLQQAGVSDGAVLHLMPRPRDSNRIPGRRRSSRMRSNRSGNNETTNSEDVSDAPNDDDQDSDGHEHDHHHHHHHHHGEHHVHTNVIIGHVAVDGRIQYRDAHDMLLSVLHAIGFSTRAVRAAAAVAAAVATSFQSSEERAAASRTVLHAAWQGTRNLQQQFARSRDTATIQAGTSDQATPSESAAENATPSSSQAPPGENSAGTEQSRTADASASPNRTPTEASEASEPSTRAPNFEASDSEATLVLLPEEPPSVGDGENVLQASERAADRLLPVVADLMETAASRIRNAPSVMNLEGSDRLSAINRLVEDLGSVAGVVTVATTLISTIIPDPEDLRTSSSGDRRPPGSENRRQGGGSANENETTNSNAPNETTNPARREEREQGQTGDRGSNQPSGASRIRGGSNHDAGSRIESRSFNFFPFGPPSEQNQGQQNEGQQDQGQQDQGQPRSNRRVRRSRRVRVSSSQAANADFMIRVLSYYLCSFSDVQSPEDSGPPEVEGQTAVSVLDSLYGRNRTARPTNILLQVAHTAMQKLTPRQFHEILQGNMLPLGEIRHEVWDEISRVIRAENDADMDRDEVEEVLGDDICEVLHEFVHILESADEANEDGVFTPGPEDFCHQIMHKVQEKAKILVRILARSRSEEDFARKMSEWIKNAVGEVLFAISSELEMQWDGLIISFRRAVYEIGKTVVGSQFSVIFPYIANLLATRAKLAFDAVAARHPAAQQSRERGTGCVNTDGEADHSNCGTNCESRMMMLHEDPSTQNDSDLDLDDESYNETESDMPDLTGADSSDDSSENSEHEIGNPDGEGIDSMTGMFVSDADKDVNCDLDDVELRNLANELAAEVQPADEDSKREASLDEDDFEAMASELIAEGGSRTDKAVTDSLPTRSTSTPKGNPSIASTASMKSIFSASGSVPSSSAHRAAFSSAAVPRSASSSSVRKSEFESVLGPHVGGRWQGVVDRDEIRVRERSYGPLSRGYSGADSVISTLDTKRGAELATEAAREAAKRAKLSPDRAKELERVAFESGSQYMKEVERAIGSRLLSDPDFDKQSFPRAAKRFLSNEYSTE